MNIDLRRLLSVPHIFRFFYSVIGAPRSNSILAEQYIRAAERDKILDIGCGLGDILQYLPSVDYSGFDMEQEYIDNAVKRFGSRGRFSCKKLTAEGVGSFPACDVVLAISVLHHLRDDEAIALFRLAKSVMKPSARLVTMDPCYTDRQSLLERYILSRDRGEHVRTRDAHVSLAREVFSSMKVVVRRDLLRIPYTHIILQCTH
ncbi:MAG: class I SAM-dependent methyltransferase [Planctomycetota bacterium]|jgi:SAM-dependent methyltransferase